MALGGGDSPAFELNTRIIGIPSIVISFFGVFVALLFFLRISFVPDQLEERGDATRKEINVKLRKLSGAIALGARTFLLKEYTYLVVVAALLFILVSAAVDWRTGLW